MRKIKFRGFWKTVNNEWQSTIGNLSIIKKEITYHGLRLDAGYYISNKAGMPFAYLVRPETIGQYTGFEDKNGKEIYEGDIVKYKLIRGFDSEEDYAESEDVREKIGEIKFRNGEFTPREEASLPDDGYYAWRTFDFEVIGNIYENKNLL